MIIINALSVETVSMVTRDDFQLAVIKYKCSRAAHLFLNVYNGDNKIIENIPIAFNSGESFTNVLLPVQCEEFDATWEITDRKYNILCRANSKWLKPREWNFYIMISSHTDIGLHNSPYIQRFNSSRFLDNAMDLCDKTSNEEEKNQYRYTIEGTWFLNNYGMDRTEEEKINLVEDFIKKDKIGVCCGVAGNHIQTYGLEEMCRSTYEKKRLYENWNVKSETMTMIDNNGLSMSLIQPYSEAGYKNIIFAPNHWNPLPSTIWQMDRTISPSYKYATYAGGGGSRIDINYNSEMPMVFYWEDNNKNRVLVWASAQYNHGCVPFGIFNRRAVDKHTLPEMEQKFSEMLPKMEKKYPYDIWLAACYWDDQEPDLYLVETFKVWNEKWKYPQLQALGNPDIPFEILREKYDNQIPVLKGDITGGWYQHPVAAADILANKFEVDRNLPTAEKWATVASILDNEYKYPAEDFRRAWDYLLFNDEHSYGVSGYQGRRVYETWMQHNDWIEKAEGVAQRELQDATQCIASKIATSEESIVVFNQTMQMRKELVEYDGKYAVVTVPPFGYECVGSSEFSEIDKQVVSSSTAPQLENVYYKISFSDNGAIESIVDKELNRELLDTSCKYRANEIVYTNDNHTSFYLPEKADFEIVKEQEKTTIIIKTTHKSLKCELVQTINLLNYEKRIDIDNRICHARDMVNDNRYYRYIYFAFPFMVENAKRLCHLNGTVAEYAKDVTGHGTDVYMAVNEWCCSENNDYGVALMMIDSQLVEFDHIHPDKTDYADAGEGSQIFVYAANDWLQMHVPGESHLSYRFRYSITSYTGTYKSAKVPQMAERYANTVLTLNVPSQEGIFKDKSKSFIKENTELRFLCLKRSDDGKGVIARFYGEESSIKMSEFCGIPVNIERNTIDEQCCVKTQNNGFITYRIGSGNINIQTRDECDLDGFSVGSRYTGLITEPSAIHGEESGKLYLVWGHNNEDDIDHYKIYRSEEADFVADDKTFVTDIFPEEFVVARYEDVGLKSHTQYFYKICAVNANGIMSRFSKEFSAYTKEGDFNSYSENIGGDR